MELVDLKDFVQDRQVLLEVCLDPGIYIIVPRTTGCLMQCEEKKSEKPRLMVLIGSGKPDVKTKHLASSDGRLTLSTKFEAVISDIFSRFDV